MSPIRPDNLIVQKPQNNEDNVFRKTISLQSKKKSKKKKKKTSRSICCSACLSLYNVNVTCVLILVKCIDHSYLPCSIFKKDYQLRIKDGFFLQRNILR